MTDPWADTFREMVRAIVREELAAVSRPEPAVRLLSVTEAAAALGIKRTALYDLIRAGRVRSLKVGSRRLVPSDVVAELVAASTKP